MANSRVVGESEFGGGGGLIQARNIANGHFNGIEQTWSVYATDPASSAEPDARRVGDPASYSRSEDGPSGVPPVIPVSAF